MAVVTGYTRGMKTAISLPDKLFEQVDAYAQRTGRSRSQLVREALVEFLLRRDDDAVTRAMDDALADIDQSADRWAQEAGRQALERTEW